ncbi:secondary alcohol dehydrogenase (SADH1) [Datura stramonium]|uniref:Secondary alcohol dehydrogenase (SADH1) n=1 Tax=Datura stramonium TaxID=4076 RepID=A0ABS8SN78_DATST|nr:secondary alcohol dehydrogenase (SADH1) [Datura stramonium]
MFFPTRDVDRFNFPPLWAIVKSFYQSSAQQASNYVAVRITEGRRITKLDQILLNGNNIAILVPGGSPPDE